MGVDIPVDRRFQSYQTPKTLRADVPVAIRASKNLEDTMLPVRIIGVDGVDFRSYQSFQQWELTFLSTVAFRVTFEKRNIISSLFGSKFPLF